MSQSQWWSTFFDDHFAEILLERGSAPDKAQEVEFLRNELQLTKGQVVFDQCCGTGEISIALAAKGNKVIGIDQCQSYITKATEKTQNTDLNCEFYTKDALQFICDEKVDAAFNWYTSFGYSDNDIINLKMLKNAYQSLKANGLFLLDYTNPAYIFKNFQEQLTLTRQLADGKWFVLKQSGVDVKRGMLTSKWTYHLPNGNIVTKSGESKIYFAHQLCEMLLQCGFSIIRVLGDTLGSEFNKDSPRCIITAQAKEHECFN